jgi:hypothetical protein
LTFFAVGKIPKPLPIAGVAASLIVERTRRARSLTATSLSVLICVLFGLADGRQRHHVAGGRLARDDLL